MTDQRVGTVDLANDKITYPKVNLAGKPFLKPVLTRRHVGNNAFVVMDGVPASFDAEAAIADVQAKMNEAKPTEPVAASPETLAGLDENTSAPSVSVKGKK